MRIVIAAPPKAGNVWLKCLLGSIYQLRQIGPKGAPERAKLDSFREWVEAGRFRDGIIYHQHYDYSPELADLIEAVPAHLVTIVRDPYDTFVSSYFTLQNHIDDERRKGRRSDVLMGKPLDHPDVLAFLDAGGFRNNMVKANSWLHSGRAAAVRYEDLHRDPMGTLKRLTDQIEPVEPERIEAAIEACSAENMRRVSAKKAQHVRVAKVGDSRERLGEAHLAIFRDRYADLIRSLGYEVR